MMVLVYNRGQRKDGQPDNFYTLATRGIKTIMFMRFRKALILAALALLTLPAIAEENEPAPTAKVVDTTVEQVVNNLSARALQIGLEAIVEKGSFYPFALLQSGEDLRIMGWNPDEAQEPPEEDVWMAMLHERIREQSRIDPTLDAAIIVQLRQERSDQGDDIPLLWSQVDHRNSKPVVIFIPFIDVGNEQFQPGEPVYLPGEQPFFE